MKPRFVVVAYRINDGQVKCILRLRINEQIINNVSRISTGDIKSLIFAARRSFFFTALPRIALKTVRRHVACVCGV